MSLTGEGASRRWVRAHPSTFEGRRWPKSLPDGFSSELCTNQQMFQNGEVPGATLAASRTEDGGEGVLENTDTHRWPCTRGAVCPLQAPLFSFGDLGPLQDQCEEEPSGWGCSSLALPPPGSDSPTQPTARGETRHRDDVNGLTLTLHTCLWSTVPQFPPPKGAEVRVKEPCPTHGQASDHAVAFPAGRVPHAVGEMP